jgi:hypothetical protein
VRFRPPVPVKEKENLIVFVTRSEELSESLSALWQKNELSAAAARGVSRAIAGLLEAQATNYLLIRDLQVVASCTKWDLTFQSNEMGFHLATSGTFYLHANLPSPYERRMPSGMVTDC